jgi:hypothetical protein
MKSARVPGMNWVPPRAPALLTAPMLKPDSPFANLASSSGPLMW